MQRVTVVVTVCLAFCSSTVVAAPQRVGNNGNSGETGFESRPTRPQIAILRDERQNSADGNFRYEFVTENGIVMAVEGRPGEKGQSNMQGSYRYPQPDGTFIEVNFVADENGYRPQIRQISATQPTSTGFFQPTSALPPPSQPTSPLSSSSSSSQPPLPGNSQPASSDLSQPTLTSQPTIPVLSSASQPTSPFFPQRFLPVLSPPTTPIRTSRPLFRTPTRLIPPRLTSTFVSGGTFRDF